MDAGDFGTFVRAFRRLSGAFRLRLTPSEADDLTKTYFRNLEAYPLDEVLLAARTCLTTLRTFPKVAEWIAALAPPASAGGRPALQALRQMSETEIHEQTMAAAMAWTGAPCSCPTCVEAGVSALPLRYVPTDERAFNPRRQAAEAVGQWIHGEALLRWYQARERFQALARRSPWRPQLALVTRDREPGEDDA